MIQHRICLYWLMTTTLMPMRHRMFFKMDETFWMNDVFFLVVEDDDVRAVVTMLPFVDDVTIKADVASSNFLCSSPLDVKLVSSSKLLFLPTSSDVMAADNLSRFVVLFFLYLTTCLDLTLALFLLPSRKLLLLETFVDGLDDSRWCDVDVVNGVDEYLSCSFWMSFRWDFDSRPWRTASAWAVTSASREARSRKILLMSTRSKSSEWRSFCDVTSMIWSPKILTLSESEKQRPKTLSQSMPKNLTLGSMSNPFNTPKRRTALLSSLSSSSLLASLASASKSSAMSFHCLTGKNCLQRFKTASRLSSISAPSWTILRMKTWNRTKVWKHRLPELNGWQFNFGVFLFWAFFFENQFLEMS